MIYILNQNSSFIPPKDHAVEVIMKHEVDYLLNIVKYCPNIVWMHPSVNITVDEFELLKKHQSMCFDSIPVPSKTRTCDSNDLIIIPLGVDCYNRITFKPINDNDPE
jgi:hypothetical protein